VELVEKALAGNRYALARLISLIEDNGTEARAALAALYPHTGQAHVVGVTGAPGTGKSTLVNELTKVLRAQGTTVGIVAVDPSSPFSGGALLGDRVRMRDLAGDRGVFIRSMATRGSLGGLARATSDVVKVLDAAGFSVVLVETVGAGQAEVDIARTAHTTVVVEAPGLGDEVQALKAGLLEIADVLVVNKADRPGAAQTARALEMVINRNAVRGGADDNAWRPPILKTIALDGSGVPEVLEAIVASTCAPVAPGPSGNAPASRRSCATSSNKNYSTGCWRGWGRSRYRRGWSASQRERWTCIRRCGLFWTQRSRAVLLTALIIAIVWTSSPA